MSLPQMVLSTMGARRPPLNGPPETDTFGQAPRTEGTRAVCFPRDDPRFAERVHGLVDGAGHSGPIAAAVQALLREDYPLAVISPRHELAAIDSGQVWYAFREGAIVPIADEATS